MGSAPHAFLLAVTRNTNWWHARLVKLQGNEKGVITIGLCTRTLSSMAEGTPKDMLQFLANYPDIEDNGDLNANLEFYSGQGRSQPDGIRLHEYQKR